MVNKGDLKDLEKRMDQRDKNLMAFIKEEFATNNQAINQAIKEMMGGLNLRLDKIEEDVKELSKKMEEDKKEQIARDRKRNNIVIYGLKKGGETEEKHDLKEKVDRVTEQLKLENEDIKFCRRIAGEKVGSDLIRSPIFRGVLQLLFYEIFCERPSRGQNDMSKM